MNDFNIQIKVDPSGAPATIASITKPLDQLEAKGKAAGDAVSAGLSKAKASADAAAVAARRAADAHERLGNVASPLARSFASVGAQMQREKDMLDQIRAPQQQYFDKLMALDKLLERNRISTSEYAQEVSKLNAAIEQTPTQPSAGGGAVGGMSALGGLMTGGVVGAAVLGMGSQIQSLIDADRQLEDRYTNLTNEALKFAVQGKSVNEVLLEQSANANTLHVTMQEEMTTYEGVRNALMDVNVTGAETARIMLTVGESAQLAGKPVDSAGEILNRLIIALNSGADAGKALKSVMIEYPALGKLLADAYHTDEGGLVRLARQHKLTAQGIVDALNTTDNAVAKSFAARKVTNEQQIAQLEEQANAYIQQGTSIATAYAMAGNKGYQDLYETIHRARDAQYDQSRTVDEATAKILALAEATEKLRGDFQKVGEAENAALGGMVDDLNTATDAVRDLGLGVATALGKDAWAGVNDKPGLLAYLFKPGTEAAMKYAAAVGDAKLKLADLDAAAGHMNALTFRSQRDALLTTINGELPEYYKQLEEIQDPQRKYNEQVAALNELLQEQKISWGEWEMQLEKASHAVGLMTENEKAWLQLQRDLEPGKLGTDAVAASEKAATDLKELSKSMQEEVTRMNHSAAEAMTKDWHQAIEVIDKSIGVLKDDAKTVLDPLKDSFVELVTTGTTSIGAMLDKMASNITAKVGDKLEGSALDAIFGKTSSQMEGANVSAAMGVGGATAGATIASQMVAAGGVVAGEIGAAMASGGATAAGLGGLAFGTASSVGTASVGALGTADLSLAAVSNVAANGVDWLVGGVGGTDSKIAQFRVTPGESVHVRTPDQRADADGRKGGSSSGPVHIHNYNYDPKAITKEIRSAVMNEVRQNRTAINALLGR